MNILIINLDKAIFSNNSASFARLKEYSRLVDKIFVIVWTTKKEQPIIYQDKLFIYPTNSLSRLFYFFNSFKIAGNILKNNKIDLIFTQDPFETGLCGWLIAKFNRIKLQLQIHGDIFSPYFKRESFANKLRIILAKFLIAKPDSFRVVSQRIKQSLIKLKIPVEKIFVSPIFTDIHRFTSAEIKHNLRSKYPQFNFIILMASRLSPEKNIALAVKAMPAVLKNNPKIGLIIAGSGPEKKNILKLIKKLKLQKNIYLEAWTDDLASYYKSADLFLLISNYEGWGLTVVEAAAAGCPVIMTDVGCANEFIINNKSGIIIPVGDRDCLENSIMGLIENENLRKKLGENAKEAIKKLPTKAEILKLYKKSWDKAIGK
ncbi:MAG: glycosyltransferase family 4 protein [Patescibacteria group bacterium]|jgi:glycosyltransferase involved in cell wall biosynthesis